MWSLLGCGPTVPHCSSLCRGVGGSGGLPRGLVLLWRIEADIALHFAEATDTASTMPPSCARSRPRDRAAPRRCTLRAPFASLRSVLARASAACAGSASRSARGGLDIVTAESQAISTLGSIRESRRAR